MFSGTSRSARTLTSTAPLSLEDELDQLRAEMSAALLPVDALVGGLARLDLADSDSIRLAQGQAVVRSKQLETGRC